MEHPQHSSPKSKSKSSKLRSWLYIAIIVVAASAVAGMLWWLADQTIRQNVKLSQTQTAPIIPTDPSAAPQLTTEVVLSGRDHVWELAFLPTKEMLFTERSGTLSKVKDGAASPVAKIDDVKAKGEGGLLGMAVDPEFTQNRFIYTCFNSSTGNDVRVVRWRLKDGLDGLEDRSDIITGMPANPSGRHSGCRLAFGPDGYLWVGTGDAAQGDTGIRPNSLGGKILRVDRGGKAAPNGLGGEFDQRIYSYGHRNVQGITFFKQTVNGVVGLSIEHGSTVDDEVNPLTQKGNFGWAPDASGYNETNVPMTDKQRFPDAIEPIWKSGSPTQAPSGASLLNGRQWKAWDGALAIGMLKSKHLKVLQLDDKNAVTSEHKMLDGTFGRLRTAVQGPDGNLYVSTDNGSDDKIVRVVPH